MKKEKVSVIRVLIQTMEELLSGLKYGIVEELGKIATIVQILIPIIIAMADFDIIQMLIISCVLTAVVRYVKEVGYKLNSTTDRGFPLPVKRFTNVSESGFISIKEEETQEAMLYLCEVEEYLKSKGWL